MEKCKKGSGLHWDVVLICLLNIPVSLIGGPLVCAVTVRALSHLSALTRFSTTHKPGESPKVIEVKGWSIVNILVLVLALPTLMLEVLYADSHSAESHFAESYFAFC
jgi:hypothetical protein